MEIQDNLTGGQDTVQLIIEWNFLQEVQRYSSDAGLNRKSQRLNCNM